MNLDQELKDKTALVTGASRKLGLSICRTLAARGVNIVVNYNRSEKDAKKLAEELNEQNVKVLAIKADVTNPDEVRGLSDQAWNNLGPVDILINNVGTYDDHPFLTMSSETFDDILAANVRSTFLMTRAVGQRMKKRGSGCVVNIAAADAFHRSHSIYGLAKQAVIYLTEALALELAPEVRINALAPDLMADNEDLDPESKFARGSISATPMGRLVFREEVAQMICLLCSSAFSFVTGQTVGLDGGRSIHRITLDSSARP